MLYALQILTVMLVALTMALSVAHALEYPGKLRLSKAEYLAVQPIYYPGFTFAGIGELLGVILSLTVAMLSPRNGTAFLLWWFAFVAMLLTHLTYWLVTHPLNNFWLRDAKIGNAGTRFFGLEFLPAERTDWVSLRDRWEFSHIGRAIFSTVALLTSVIAISV